eukprot:scaffold85916_cov30-Tisochrysis_lutea.AAC.8
MAHTKAVAEILDVDLAVLNGGSLPLLRGLILHVQAGLIQPRSVQTAQRVVDAEVLSRSEGDNPDLSPVTRLLDLPDHLRELRVGARRVEDLLAMRGVVFVLVGHVRQQSGINRLCSCPLTGLIPIHQKIGGGAPRLPSHRLGSEKGLVRMVPSAVGSASRGCPIRERAVRGVVGSHTSCSKSTAFHGVGERLRAPLLHTRSRLLLHPRRVTPTRGSGGRPSTPLCILRLLVKQPAHRRADEREGLAGASRRLEDADASLFEAAVHVSHQRLLYGVRREGEAKGVRTRPLDRRVHAGGMRAPRG